MKLLSLKMSNFRQFYGDSPQIRFAHGEKNITTFHGTNGAGKTALLNAFTWLLFDETTRGFQFPDQIVNLRAIREAADGDKVSAFVELTFDHQDRKYTVRRTAEVIRTSEDPGWIGSGKSQASLQWAGPDGTWHPEDRVQDVIGRILPPDLHSYFFFDGERIERIVQPTKNERREIAEATKKLLGVEILDRAVTHLTSARREIEKELKKVGDAETRKYIEEKQSLEDDRVRKSDRLREIDRNLEAQKERQEEVEKRLRELEDTRAVQERRDQLVKELESRNTSLTQQSQQLADKVSAEGYAVLLGGAVGQFQDMIKDLHDRGELPSGIKRNFVEALLRDGTCICGTDLSSHENCRKNVEDWMHRAGLVDVEEKAIRMDGEVRKIAESVPRFLEGIDQIQHQMDGTRKAIHRIEDELDDIRTRLENSPREEVSRLERQRESIIDQMRELNQEYGGIQQNIRDIEERLAELEGLIKRHKAHEEKQDILQRQIAAAQEAIDRIMQTRELLEESFREGLTQKIRVLFDEISPTPYVPELTPNYDLRLLNSAGGSPVPVAASEGESQILSLAFIGSIITLAREYQAKQEHLPGPESSSYPLVMDSPFGKLGPTYRMQIAEHIPALADQVVVMVTDTQWRGEVDEAMKSRRGRSYVLTYFTPREGVPDEAIKIDGQTFELVKTSPNEFEYTEIREVIHA